MSLAEEAVIEDEEWTPFFGGSISDAITTSRNNNRMFVVVVHNHETALIQTILRDKILAQELQRHSVIIKVDHEYQDALHLKQFFDYDNVPMILYIGMNGIVLQRISGDRSKEQLLHDFEKAYQLYQKQQGILLMSILHQQQQQQQPQQPLQQQAKQLPKSSPSTRTQRFKPNPTTTVSKPTYFPPSYTHTTIIIKLTNGFALRSTFASTDRLLEVKKFVDTNQNDGKHPYFMMITHPKRIFSEDDFILSLSALDLLPSATITLSSLDPKAKPLPPPSIEPAQQMPDIGNNTSTGSSDGNSSYYNIVKEYVSSWFAPFWYPPATSSETSTTSTSSISRTSSVQRIHTLRTEEQNKESSSKDTKKQEDGVIKRRNKYHQLPGQQDTDQDDGTNSYYNGNSTQFK